MAQLTCFLNQKSTLLKQCIDQYSGAETELENTRKSIQRKKSHMKELGKEVAIILTQLVLT